MSSEKTRQELIDSIERGAYKTHNSGNSKIALVIFFVAFLCMFFPVLFSVIPSLVRSGGRIGYMFGATALVFLFFIILVAFLPRFGKRIANLGKLSAQDKELILHGDKIEADLDSIDQVRGGYQIKCNANYHGQTLQLASPIIGVRPIPFDEQKINVFIDPQSSSRYLVNFYEHIPLVSEGNVLQDRSELKCEPRIVNKNEGQVATIIVAVICCMIASGAILTNGLFILFAILAAKTSGFSFGSIIGNLLGLIGVPALMFFIIYKVKTSADNRRNILMQGYYVEAVGDRTWTTSDDDGHTTYHLAARYIEPKTKIMHEFTDSSGTSWIRKLVGVKIRVYINPENTKQYVMCSSDAEKNMGFTADKDE